MDIYTMQEEAAKRGEERGYTRGFADGIHAAGIAPIQWRDAAKYPFEPEEGKNYLILQSGQTIPEIFDCPDCWIAPLEVAFWCLIDLPFELTQTKEAEDGNDD